MSEPHVRLPLREARMLLEFVRGFAMNRPSLRRARAALEHAVEAQNTAEKPGGDLLPPLKFPKPQAKDRKAKKRAAEEEYYERMRVIREALAKRANYRFDGEGPPLCEKCGAKWMDDPHHLFGRGKGRPPESERTCVGVCRRCHRLMQHPPTFEVAVENWDWAARHLQALGFEEEATMAWARAKKCRTRAELSRAGEAVRTAEVSRAAR